VAICSPAHTLYSLRIRILNEDTEEEQWVTVDYILIVRKRKEPGAAARAQQRRSAVLQRVLYLVSLLPSPQATLV